MGYTRREDCRVPMASGEVFRATKSPRLRLWPARCVPSVVTLVVVFSSLTYALQPGQTLTRAPW